MLRCLLRLCKCELLQPSQQKRRLNSFLFKIIARHRLDKGALSVVLGTAATVVDSSELSVFHKFPAEHGYVLTPIRKKREVTLFCVTESRC